MIIELPTDSQVRYGLTLRPVSPSRVSSRSRPLRVFGAFTVVLLLLAASAVPPASAAQAGFAFLEIPTGARASALGGAYATLAEGAGAIFWNPAGLSGMHGVQVAGGHYELFQSLRHDHFSIAGPAWGGGVGASIRALYSEAIDERDELGNLIGSFGSHDIEFALGYGGPLAAGIDAGVSAQVVTERIANASATTYAFGLGATWDVPRWSGLRASLAAMNLGPSAQFKDGEFRGEDVALPMAVQGGASYRYAIAPQFDLRTALEARLTKGRSTLGIVAAEVVHASGAALRVGLRGGDTTTRFSVGVGYLVGSLALDYAYVPFQLDLGDTHRFAFVAQF